MAWEVGTTFSNRGQAFVCVAVEPYTRRDGSKTRLVVLQSACWQCGALFRFKIPFGCSYDRVEPNRRCDKHKRPGRIAKRSKPKVAVGIFD